MRKENEEEYLLELVKQVVVVWVNSTTTVCRGCSLFDRHSHRETGKRDKKHTENKHKGARAMQ